MATEQELSKELETEQEFEVLFKFGGSNKLMIVTGANLPSQIDKHLAELGFDSKKLETGEYLLQKWNTRWNHFVNVKLCEVAANDIITIAPVDIKAEAEQSKVSASNCTIN